MFGKIGNQLTATVFAACMVLTTSGVQAQHAAGGIIAEIKDIDIAIVAEGWSVVQILRGGVYNDLGEFVGYIHDAIVTQDGESTFVIVNVAGFLNIRDKLVAVPTIGFELRDDGNLILPGATKEALKALPAFRYAIN